uniref:Piwi domain-containing protein n=1 Tax=Panagrolaimus davidi TaxID=227884 RepID=A0A914PW56_9BILA
MHLQQPMNLEASLLIIGGFVQSLVLSLSPLVLELVYCYLRRKKKAQKPVPIRRRKLQGSKSLQANLPQVNGERIDLFQSFLQDAMIMGFYMTHPSPGSSEDIPSVCGYSFTINKCGNVARGGFVYTKPRQYVLSEDELRKPLEDAVKLYFEENGSYPQRVLVYRFGTSDGEIEKILAEECGFVMNELTAAMNGKTAKLTVIAVPPFQNVTPGTCVPGTTESDIVMVPHRALQRTPKPTIFPSCGDADLTPHFLKNITHAFCYMHEIVDSAISVPHTLRSAVLSHEHCTSNQLLYPKYNTRVFIK